MERNLRLGPDGGGKEGSVAGENEYGPAVTAFRPKHGELRIAEDEGNRELGVLCGLTTNAFVLGSRRDVILSKCFPLASLRLASAKRVGVS